ncbi:presequence protease, mitochondrial-like [Piliocolobus tephrosceles]|uniref:presequence protease, mitochondrial-like n=1 Tax=Piliocolobus tephrosceles TaxID=591936 RepID=UPI00130160FE|nr:presequence protease, mitochondrial-like [Piliocolobus tephrosceles]
MWHCGAQRGLCALRLLSGGHAHHRAWRWNSNRACERDLQYQLGDKIHGFTVNQCAVPVQFRTTPMDSTGVPHILQHTILCGSQKYPCRDPFFKMLNRSLSMFMNAFTGRTSILNEHRVWVCQAPTGIQLVSEKG